jgi:hypothetical protein
MDHLQLGSPLHIKLLQNIVQEPKDTTEPVDSIPSTNGWTNRTNECLDGAVLEAVDYVKTEQLGKNATNCGVCPQLLKERYYMEISPSTANWHQPTDRHKTHRQSHTHSS